jgi:AcrR family transcriptional regulator
MPRATQAAVALDSRSRTRILAAAQKQFAALGYRRTAIADITRQAGIAAGTFYRYFASKEDVFREVVRGLHEDWLARAREATRPPGTAAERLGRMGQASVEYNRENALINAVFRRDEQMIFAPLLDELHDALLRQNVALIAEILRDGARDGTLRETMDAEKAAYVLFMAGATLSDQQNQVYFAYPEVLPVYVDILMNGLLPRGKEGP